ncbi:MAG: 4Fe-4S dicluster domain-containing protein [Gemmatimonadetes bacterium]|nr:4Fe-4S dicluster domain-containing protein [Gemmatimonadota bacterium]NIO33115.1 4Fe-4S dicluster domain-containing protein [Gemmatimonadota bacterium]
MSNEVPQTAGSSPAEESKPFDRREFLKKCGLAAPILLGVVRVPLLEAQDPSSGEYDPSEHLYGMGIDVNKCIGCGQCVVACKTENDVPVESEHFNTWVERYIIRADEEVAVDSPNGGIDGFPPTRVEGGEVRRTFFVPKLCNHCAEAPCVQVCPVGATFTTEDGAVLVDDEYCIGCRYCIQACPYGARWLHPETHVAAKCTFCYHRLVDGLVPACVEVCPTGARLFGELEGRATPLARFRRFNELQVLKPHLNTRPKVYYANLDGEVR